MHNAKTISTRVRLHAPLMQWKPTPPMMYPGSPQPAVHKKPGSRTGWVFLALTMLMAGALSPSLTRSDVNVGTSDVQVAVSEFDVGEQFANRASGTWSQSIVVSVDEDDVDLQIPGVSVGGIAGLNCIDLDNATDPDPGSASVQQLQNGVYCVFTRSDDDFNFIFYQREAFYFDFETIPIPIDRQTDHTSPREIVYDITFIGLDTAGDPTGNSGTATLTVTVSDADEGRPIIISSGTSVTGLTIEEGSLNNEAVQEPDTGNPGATVNAEIVATDPPKSDPRGGARGDVVTGFAFIGAITIQRTDGTTFTVTEAGDINFPFALQCSNVVMCDSVSIRVNSPFYLDAARYTRIDAFIQARDSNSEPIANPSIETTTRAINVGWSDPISIQVTIVPGADDPPRFDNSIIFTEPDGTRRTIQCEGLTNRRYAPEVVEGSPVAIRICAQDPDPGDQNLRVLYELEDLQNIDDAALFELSDQGRSDQGVLLTLRDDAVPDFEVRSQYSFLVTASSASPTAGAEPQTSTPVPVTITIINRDEKPRIDDQQIPVSPTAAGGDDIGQIEVADPGDSTADNPSLTYELDATIPGTTPGAQSVFAVDEDTGVVSIREGQGLGDTNPWIIGIRVTDEDLCDPDNENRNANLCGPNNDPDDMDEALVTIVAESALLTVDSLTVAEDNPDSEALVPIRVQGRLANDLVLVINTRDDGATAGIDYRALSNSRVTIPAGIYNLQDTPVVVRIEIIDDNVDNERNENIIVTASLDAQTTALRPGVEFTSGGESGVVMIAEDDAPAASFSVAELAQDEGQTGTTDIEIIVQLSPPASSELTINYSILEESTASIDDLDYSIEGIIEGVGSLTLDAGATQAVITVTVMGDTDIEPDETVLFRIDSGEGYIVGAVGDLEFLINDDDAPVVVFPIPSETVDEGDSGSTERLVSVELNEPAEEPLTIHFNIATAATAAAVCPDTAALDPEDLEGTADLDADYQLAGTIGGAGSLQIAIGDRDETLRIRVLGDESADEGDEFVVLCLREGVGYRTGADAVYRLTIVDDDAPDVQFSVAEATVTEGDRGDVTSYDATVNLATPLTDIITVNYEVLAESTASPDDYRIANVTERQGSVDIAAGAVSASFQIVVLGDEDSEGDELLTLRLFNEAAYNIGENGSLDLTIQDNDTLQANFEAAASSVTESDTADINASVVVELNRVPTAEETLIYSLIGGTAVFDANYCLPDPEPPEEGEDPPPLPPVREDTDYCIEGAIPAATFVTANPELELSDDAVAFIAVAVPPGLSDVDIPIILVADPISELNETVILRLEAISSGTIGAQNEHTLTIANNDPGSTVPERAIEINFLSQAATTASLGLLIDSLRPRLSEYPGGYSEFGALSNLAAQLAYGIGTGRSGSDKKGLLRSLSNVSWNATIGARSLQVENLAAGKDSAILWLHGGSKNLEGSTSMARSEFEYDGYSAAFTVGLERTLSDPFTLGLSLSYTESSFDYDLEAVREGAAPTDGKYDEYGAVLSVYTVLRPGRHSRLWMVVGAGYSDVDDKRDITDPNAPPGTPEITEEADSSATLLMFGMGFEYALVSALSRLPLELDIKTSAYTARKSLAKFRYSDNLTVPKSTSILSEVRTGLRFGASIGLGLSGAHIHPYIGLDGIFNVGEFHLDNRKALDVIAGLTWQQDRLRLLLEGNREFMRGDHELWGAYIEARYVTVPGQVGFLLQAFGRYGSSAARVRPQSPQWGTAFSEGPSIPGSSQTEKPGWRLGLESSYSIRTGLWGGGIVTPFLIAEPGRTQSLYVAGMRFQANASWRARLELQRSNDDQGKRDAGASVSMQYHF